MKKIKIIGVLIAITEFQIAAGIIFAVVFILSMDDGTYMFIGEPYLKVTSKELQSAVIPLLPVPTGEPLLMNVDTVDISLRVDSYLKGAIILLVLVYSAYAVSVLEVFRRVVRSVKKNSPFQMENIKRVKLAGLLIAVAPLFEYILRRGFMFWLNTKFEFEGMRLVSESYHGSSVFILGLLIIVMGVAFEQGQKIQEDNELTI